MEKQTVFIKRYPSKGEFPKVNGKYWCKFKNFSDALHQQEWVLEFGGFGDNECYDYWLEEIELPSDVEIRNNLLEQGTSANYALYQSGHEDGANFILNHLKSNTNGKL